MNRIARTIVFFVMFGAGQATAKSPQQSIDAEMDRLLGTLNVRSEPHLSDGKLMGCQLVFDALHRDWTYRKGAMLKVSGSIGLMAPDKNGGFGTVLKVVVLVADTKTYALRPEAPTRAYLLGADYQTSLGGLIKSGPSDTPGGLFSIFQAEPAFGIIAQALQDDRLSIAFNKAGGATDIKIPIARRVCRGQQRDTQALKCGERRFRKMLACPDENGRGPISS